MSEQLDTRIDAALRSMLAWEDPSPRTWEKALLAQAAVPRRRVVALRPRLLAAALLLMVALVTGAILPSLSKARSTRMHVSPGAPAAAGEYDFAPLFDFNSALQNAGGGRGSFVDNGFAEHLQLSGRERLSNAQSEPAPIPRLVERRATLELEVADARAAYVKARALVSEARGEFVQGGRISEQGEHHRADLVLRVQGARLDEVLDALRSLGTVKDERLDAADVTEKMVDLEARLANERRIETELLGLLDKRPDDKLEDILRVRAELAGVRERIERLVAQRSNLSSLVALSTITILISEPADKPVAQPEETGLWSTFKYDVADAWRNGVEALLRFVVWLIEIAITGLPLWIITAAAVVFAWRSYRRRRPRRLPV
ncbi:MAG: DUF4349 domain-containing protein [Leptolyngbya sp. PLA3]|nr:MAG: DUF4349 domain-containing protein [Cyanobacteria bacterium CYA]MCE7967478.1 DUF4349 domain-containing protein [Leptolyngbya sp. PL-A3]